MSNLFTSAEWLARIQLLKNTQDSKSYWSLKRYWGLRILRPQFAELTDYELWPAENVSLIKKPSADMLIHRKLLNHLKPAQLPKGAVVWQDSATFRLDLKKPLEIKKDVLFHLGRTERKLTREWGSVEVIEATDLTKDAWFAQWFHHLGRRYPESPLVEKSNHLLLKKWILDLPIADWMKLISLRVGDHTLAWALCYSWNGQMYLFAPIMTTVPEFAKYGPGKLLTHKIIQQAQSDRYEVFDFLQGEHAYKLDWNPQRIPLYACLVPMSFVGSLGAQYMIFGKK